MRANGLLYIETRTSGGMNEYGEPLGDSVQWCETPVECSISPNTDTRLGRYEDGEFHQASYTVLVEGRGFRAERIKLIRQGENLGEFRIVSINPLSVSRTLIIV